jgi:hypothetical protein
MADNSDDGSVLVLARNVKIRHPPAAASAFVYVESGHARIALLFIGSSVS